jgi:acyl transferase domain-containing protein/NAD(P)-dependent dehydrogenase (short-subunit alcohol dehydrogenase family)/acyl carrier protein
LGCLFPRAHHGGAFWATIKNGVDCITEIPPTHWRPEDYFSPQQQAPDMTYARRGGFLSPLDFSPIEFGISPRDLDAIDTAQLLGLVAAQQALFDAGYTPEAKFDRSKVSVILGVTGTQELVIPLGARLGHPRWRKALLDSGVDPETTEEVVSRIAESYVSWQENSFPGLLGNVVAGRIANRLDLGGTNCVVDAACASSLSAIHLAGMELSTGRAEVAVTGGVDTFNDIFMYMCFSKTPALSPTGNSKPFDRDGDGTILGEGLGVVVLKRLADAERDGNRIYAVIRSIGSSSDGKGAAIYAPVASGQVKALKRAYAEAGISPATIELVEAHGTGTKVGDAVEVDALTQVYREARPDGTWCALGSIKSQIGHTKAAAGAAGLIKAALALHFKVLPPTIKVNQPLEPLQPGKSPFYLNSQKRPWLPSTEHPRRAAVSAFGFGGSNFHAVLEEYRPAKSELDWDGDCEIFAISGETRESIQDRLNRLKPQANWTTLQEQARLSRQSFDTRAEHRLLLVLERDAFSLAKSLQTAQSLLKRPERFLHSPDGVYYGRGVASGSVGVLFPGQGSQYVGMLRDLACLFPQMQEVLSEGNRIFSASDGERLSDRIYPPPAFDSEGRTQQEQTLRQTQIAQPGIGAVALGALRVLESFGLDVAAYAGHSYGELPALCAAGVFDSQALHHLSRLRGHLMNAHRDGDAGSMLAVHAPLHRIEELLSESRLDLVIANKNAPNQTVLSGSTPAIEAGMKLLQSKQIRQTRLPVAAAFHSRLVSEASRPFREVLETIPVQAARTTVFANTTAERYPDAPEAIRSLLAGQLSKPVEFVREIASMAEAGVRTFVEVGPGATLSRLVESILKEETTADWDAVSLDASQGRRSGIVDLGHLLARLAARGHSLNLKAWQAGRNWFDPNRTGKPGTVAICGANYTKPRAPRSPQTKRTPPSTQAPQPGRSAPVNDPKPEAPQGLPQALQLTQQSLDAFQRLQEQTAQLHRQFLEQQETAQRTLQALVEQQQFVLQASLGNGVPLPVFTPLPPAPVRRPEPTPVLTPAPVPAPQPAKKFEVPSTQMFVPPAPAPITVAPRNNGVEVTLLSVVSEKTGYPVEMLNLDMTMDSDLGIDSIKRVEILSTLQDRLPEAPIVRPEHLGTLHTLRDVAGFLSLGASRLAEELPASPRSQLASGDVDATLLNVVSEKTGYPVEMLNLDMTMDSDLGIDSIKRVEILSTLQDRLPQAPIVKPEHLGTLQTLRDVGRFLAGKAEPAGSTLEVEPAGEHPSELQIVEVIAADDSPAPELLAPEPVSVPQTPIPETALNRLVLRAVPLHQIDGRARLQLLKGGTVWLVADPSSLSVKIAQQFHSMGLKPQFIAWNDSPFVYQSSQLAGLVLLAPEGKLSDDFPVKAFRWIRHAGTFLKQSASTSQPFLVSITSLDGSFGLEKISPNDPISGSLAGMVKTVAREWLKVFCKAIDLDPLVARNSAFAIAEECVLAGPVEVGISSLTRNELITEANSPTVSEGPLLHRDDCVLVTGGARGVTFEAVLSLASYSPAKFVLLGRTPAPQLEPDWLHRLHDESAIKQAISKHLLISSPKEISREYQRITAQREIQTNLQRLRETGAECEYRSVDVQNSADVSELLDAIRQEFGSLRGIIHGAGILADRKIEDLTDDQFNAVYSTKVQSLHTLLDRTKDDSLKLLALFSSSTARLGRIGQFAYAAANEALNKIAQQQTHLHPDCRVVAINWGPWDGGMVTPGLKQLFAREGVACIPLRNGGDFFVREVQATDMITEVVAIATAPICGESASPILEPPKSEARPGTLLNLAFERVLAIHDHAILRSHLIDRRAVLPLALHLEFMAHAALLNDPNLKFLGCDQLRLLNGVTIEDHLPAVIRLFCGKARRDGTTFIVPVELRGRKNGKEVLHSRGEILLGSKLLPAEIVRSLPRVEAYPDPLESLYTEQLFHGPLLRCLDQIEGTSLEGILARCRIGATPEESFDEPLRDHWLVEPFALDSAFQAMILWTISHRDAPSLPCYVGQYRQFVKQFDTRTVYLTIRITRGDGSLVRAEIDFTNAKGELLARISDYECVVDPTLRDAFRRNHFAGPFVG